MANFVTEIQLQNLKVSLKELKIKHFKILLKSLVGESPDLEIFYKNLTNILVDITSLSYNELTSLSVLDFLKLILYIRCLSIGSIVQLEIKDQKNTKLNLNLTKIIDTLNEPIPVPFTQDFDKFQINYQILNIKNYLFGVLDENSLIKESIKNIIFRNNTQIQIEDLNKDTFLQIFNSLPASCTTEIFKQVTNLIKYTQQTNLLKHLENSNLFLYINRETFSFFMQILFSKNLLPLYENIFALSKFANLSPSYIEDCTPGEYTIFVKILERIFKEQATQQTQGTRQLPPINQSMPNFM